MPEDMTIGSLRKMSEEKVLDILTLKSSSPGLFDDLFKFFYVKRFPLTINEICSNLNVEYQAAYGIIIKLVRLGLLAATEESKNNFMLSQEGIDFYLNYSKLEFENNAVDAISKKHAVEMLRLLQIQEYNWTGLRERLKVSESSMKNLLDSLVNSALMSKGNTYSITDEGNQMLNSLERLGNLEFTPRYEVQIKALLTKEPIEIVKKIRLLSESCKEEYVKQIDHYIKPSYDNMPGSSSLRLRSESLIGKQSLKSAPEHSLTWSNIKERIRHEDMWIISRQKEDIIVPYPAISFFLDFLGAKIQKKIVKKRTTIKIPEMHVTIHLDDIEIPRPGRFIELKAGAWNQEEAKEKASIIHKLVEDLELGDLKSIDQTYYEFA